MKRGLFRNQDQNSIDFWLSFTTTEKTWVLSWGQRFLNLWRGFNSVGVGRSRSDSHFIRNWRYFGKLQIFVSLVDRSIYCCFRKERKEQTNLTQGLTINKTPKVMSNWLPSWKYTSNTSGPWCIPSIEPHTTPQQCPVNRMLWAQSYPRGFTKSSTPWASLEFLTWASAPSEAARTECLQRNSFSIGERGDERQSTYWDAKAEQPQVQPRWRCPSWDLVLVLRQHFQP